MSDHLPSKLPHVDRSWTLFLDRDGVINREKYKDYVYSREEFSFYHGVPQAIASLSAQFGLVLVTTNQRGIGKGLMSEADLEDIHAYMNQEIQAAGGRIDRQRCGVGVATDDA